MPLPRLRTALLVTAALLPGRVVAADLPFTGADIEAAAFSGADLPGGRSPLTAKVQMLLDRAGISPGVTDGYRGGMSESAIRAFERQRGLPVDGILDATIWAQLQAYAVDPVTQSYTITAADAEGLVPEIPTDYAEKAQMSHMGYTSIGEKLAERFHMDERFIAFLNPGVALDPGATITVMRPAKPLRATVTRIIIDKATRRVAAYDAAGALVADYPATIGSDTTPSPSGTHAVEAVALNPNYTYDPSKNFRQGENDKVLVVPPGPNGPVGTVWIDLSQPTYGIHGTPTPSRLFVSQSYGCVRLTNWDAWELAHMVKAKTTTVEFLAPGTSIADVTSPPASSGIIAEAPVPAATQAARPLARPESVVLAAAFAAGEPLPATSGAAARGVTAATPTASGTPAGTAPAGRDTATAPQATAPDPLAAALAAASGGAVPVQQGPAPAPVPVAPAAPPEAQPVPEAGEVGTVTITPASPVR